MKHAIETWKWKGLPGHLCVAKDCIFRLHTIIGRYKISTIGGWYPKCRKQNDPMEEIGRGRHYETFVFIDDGLSEIDSDGLSLKDIPERDPYKADEIAEKMHMNMCFKYANHGDNE